MRHSTYNNEMIVKGMDTMKLRCVMMVIDKRQDTLVDDRLCSKEKGQQYARKRCFADNILVENDMID